MFCNKAKLENSVSYQFIPYIVQYSLSGIGSACCNQSNWEDGIRGWHEDESPPKEVARSFWCLHHPYGHVKHPLGNDMALGLGQGP